MNLIPEFYNFVKIFFSIILGLLLWIIVILPVGLLLLLPFAILRLFVHFLAGIFQPDLIPIRNGVESGIIFNPSLNYSLMNTAQVWKIKGKLEVQEFRTHFYDIFLSTQELREKYRNLYCYFVQWMGYCFKKPVGTLVLEDQIREYKLGRDESLDKFIGTWMARNEYGNRPNWEILIISMQNQGYWESVLLFKIDHGLCDGYTFVHLVEKLSGIKSPYLVKDDGIGFWKKVKLVLTFPVQGIKVSLQLLGTKSMIPPPTRKSGEKMSKKRLSWFISFTTLDLETIKRVRQKTKSHFNTVVAMLHIGSLRRHLMASGKVTSVSKLPNYTWIGSPTGVPGHPAMTHGGMTNHLTMDCSQSPFREPDPLVRLQIAEKNFVASLDDGFRTLYWWFMIPAVWPVPAPLFRLGTRMSSNFIKICHCVSPLICASESYTLMGLEVDHLYLPVHVPAILPPVHLYIVPVSNSGRLDISINGTTELFETQEELDLFTKVYMKEELEKLVRGCGLDLPEAQV